MAFRGHFDYSLDAKNRLNVPPRFRAALAEGVVLAQGLEPCVELWAPAPFERYATESLSRFTPLSKEHRWLSRYFAGNSFDADLDSAGRVNLPPALLEHAGIEKEVEVVGNNDRVEVWARDRWVEHQRELDANVVGMAESVGHPA